jgi:ubiquinone/menaquinone biosynthesis C-methylase UbiE
LHLGIDWTPRRYSRFSKIYDLAFDLFFPIGKRSHQRVLDGLESGSSILDVACGTGTLLRSAQAAGLKGFGLDYSEGMVHRAGSKVPGSPVVLADSRRLPYPDETFDYVVETNALSGMDTQDAVKTAVAEMVRVCKRGGEIRIGDYATPPVQTWQTRLIERLMGLLGDRPYNFASILTQMGCYVTYEAIGWHGMYQHVNARCSS